ncbi:PREDICTED: jouberin-like [Branchiostoma belcheri]|uniref:Jouberin-like n=1 Tax=Branchiostoma belcheri TaxID=7741 RepID=A0A6P4YZ94_BRABE|nr:PREDICTED: jouberin-like [Branchiostoma belcheri]
MAEEIGLNSMKQRRKKKSSRRPPSSPDPEEDVPSPVPGSRVNDLRPKTKAKLNQLLEAAMEEAKTEEGGKKKKKGKKKPSAETVLDALREGADLRKDSADDLNRSMENNSYDSPRNNKNRRRQEESVSRSTDTLDEGERSPGKKKKKKKSRQTTEDTDQGDEPMTIEELASTKKKTKKKRPPSASHSDMTKANSEEMLDQYEQALETRQEDEQEEEGEASPRRKGKGKGKKSRRRKAESTEEEIVESPRKQLEDEGKVLGITVHKSDPLKTDLFILHPLVRVHICDMDTGNYVRKLDKNRPVTSFYETQRREVEYILPIMTQPFDFKKKKSMLPAWEELLIFNENFNLFTQEEDPRVVVLFEVLDFVTMSVASNNYRSEGQQGGWHRIAWAFLKVVGSNKNLNTDKKVRLQLFYPPFKYKPKPDVVDVFDWWQNLPRQVYPSTLYVTVKGIKNPGKVEAAPRSMVALQEEKGRMTYKEMKLTAKLKDRTSRTRDETEGPGRWSRLKGQVCRLPNKQTLSLQAGRMGCMVVRFSPNGRMLACGCADKDSYPIMIYEIPDGSLKGTFLGHHNIVYDLSWSPDNNRLFSASSDGTARVWNADTLATSAEKVLPHPSFVYTVSCHPVQPGIIVTGGYDHVIRVWISQGDGVYGQLLKEMEGHQGLVNSLCFDREGMRMFSADSEGVIIIWNTFVHEQPRRDPVAEWNLHHQIREEELRGVTINSIQLHHGGRRLLVHGRDNTVRLVDLRLYSVMQRYHGALNSRQQVRSVLTPCGSFVIAGSEDSCAYVWNTETGDKVAVYRELGYQNTVCGLDFHPHDHMVAFCCYGDNNPILIYTYDQKVARLDAGVISDDLPQPMSPVSPVGKTPVTPLATQSTFRAETPMGADLTSLHEESRRANRMDRAIQLLSSVSRSPRGSYQSTPGVQGTTMLNSTWGSTFDRTPYTQSPLSTWNQQRGWTPDFVPVGGRPGSPGKGSAPQVSFQAQRADHRKRRGDPPRVTFDLGSAKKGPSVSVRANRATSPLRQTVVALYDYQANRSDELTIQRGDRITVLYKDNENWWFGELEDGQQGFFPSNYITEEADWQDQETPQGEAAAGEEEDTNTRMSAVTTKSGELKILSGPDSDTEDTSQKSRSRRKKKQGSKENLINTEDDSLVRTTKSSRRLKKREQIPAPGYNNYGFEN